MEKTGQTGSLRLKWRHYGYALRRPKRPSGRSGTTRSMHSSSTDLRGSRCSPSRARSSPTASLWRRCPRVPSQWQPTARSFTATIGSRRCSGHHSTGLSGCPFRKSCHPGTGRRSRLFLMHVERKAAGVSTISPLLKDGRYRSYISARSLQLHGRGGLLYCCHRPDRATHARTAGSASPRRWRPSAPSPGASPTTSTISLQPSSGLAEMVEEDLPPESPSIPRIQRVLSAASRGTELVRQILAFSRKTEPTRKPLSLSPLVKETIQFLRASLPTTIEIKLTMKAARDTILASPTELQQIIMNLVTNASFAMKEKGGILGINVTNIDFEPDSPVLDAGCRTGRVCPTRSNRYGKWHSTPCNETDL